MTVSFFNNSTSMKLFPPKLKKLLETILVVIMLMTVTVFWWEMIDSSEGEYWHDNEYCNVSNIKFQGHIVTYISNENKDEDGISLRDETSSEDIVKAIEKAERDNDIKAIVLEIDSLGGCPVASEEVTDALKKAKKPTVALIREYGISAAYHIATGADIIFASQNSAIGGIGVTMSYLDHAEENKKDGLTYNQLSVGKFKDAGNSDKPLTPEEKELFMRDINILHENFIKVVAENRKIDIEKVRPLADGSTMLGPMAIENNLIDQIGGRYEVEEYLREKLGGDIKICQ